MCSELHFFIHQRRAKHFAWLSGTGIYHGDLNFGAQHRYIVILISSCYLLLYCMRDFHLVLHHTILCLSTLFLPYILFLSSATSGDENFVENKGLLDYSKLGEATKPRSLAVSEFHFLLLIGNRVKVQILMYEK